MTSRSRFTAHLAQNHAVKRGSTDLGRENALLSLTAASRAGNILVDFHVVIFIYAHSQNNSRAFFFFLNPSIFSSQITPLQQRFLSFYGSRFHGKKKKKRTIEKKSLSFKKFPCTQLLHTSVRDYVNHLEATNELAQGHLP